MGVQRKNITMSKKKKQNNNNNCCYNFICNGVYTDGDNIKFN